MLHPPSARFLILATLSLTPPALAQNPPVWIGEEIRSAIDPQLGSASFGRMVGGDFTSDAIPDAAGLRNGTIVYVLGVGVYSVTGALPGTFNDLAVYDIDASDGPDLLVTVGPGGLELWSSWTEPQSVEIGGGVWDGATHVRVADLDGDGDLDIVGVADDGSKILRFYRDAPADPMAFTAASVSANAPASVIDISPAQWNGVGGAELLVLTTDGLYVLHDATSSFTLVSSLSATDSAFGLTTLTSSAAGQRAAWLQQSATNGEYSLRVADASVVEPAVSLGLDLDPVGLASGKIFGVSAPDVWVSHQFNAMQVLLKATNGNPTYSVADPNAVFMPVKSVLIDNFDPYPLNQHTPLVIDVDGDGDDDFVFAVEDATQPELLVSYNPFSVHDDQKVSITAAGFANEGPVNEFHLTIDAPTFVPSNRDQLECWVFRKPDLESPIDADGVDYVRVPITEWPVTLTLELENTSYFFDDLYFFQLRMIEVDGATIVDGGPLRYAIAAQGSENKAAVEAIGIGPTIQISVPIEPKYVGGVVPVPCPPNATNCPTPPTNP